MIISNSSDRINFFSLISLDGEYYGIYAYNVFYTDVWKLGNCIAHLHLMKQKIQMLDMLFLLYWNICFNMRMYILHWNNNVIKGNLRRELGC